MTPDVVRLCAKCGTSSIETDELANKATCNVCGWQGAFSEAVIQPFKHSFFSGQSAHTAFIKETQVMEAKALGVPLLKQLVTWGFIESGMSKEDTAKAFTVYVKNVAEAVVRAIVETRAAQEKAEKQVPS